MRKFFMWMSLWLIVLSILLANKDKIFAASESQTQVFLSVVNTFSGLASIGPWSGTFSSWIYQTNNSTISFFLESSDASQFTITGDIQTVILWGSGLAYSWIVSTELTASYGIKYIFINFSSGIEYLPPQVFTINFFPVTPPPSTPSSPSSTAWWGWGLSESLRDICPWGDSSPSYYDGLCSTVKINSIQTIKTGSDTVSPPRLPVRIIPVIQKPQPPETTRTEYQTDKPPNQLIETITTILNLKTPEFISTVIEKNTQYITEYNDRNQENTLIITIEKKSEEISKIIRYNSQSSQWLRDWIIQMIQEIYSTIQSLIKKIF